MMFRRQMIFRWEASGCSPARRAAAHHHLQRTYCPVGEVMNAAPKIVAADGERPLFRAPDGPLIEITTDVPDIALEDAA
jgi:hypothetical protein